MAGMVGMVGMVVTGTVAATEITMEIIVIIDPSTVVGDGQPRPGTGVPGTAFGHTMTGPPTITGQCITLCRCTTPYRLSRPWRRFRTGSPRVSSCTETVDGFTPCSAPSNRRLKKPRIDGAQFGAVAVLWRRGSFSAPSFYLKVSACAPLSPPMLNSRNHLHLLRNDRHVATRSSLCSSLGCLDDHA